MDYQSLLYNPIYQIAGVAASLALATAPTAPITGLTVIDKTAGVDVGDSVQEQVLVPAAVIRAKELADNSITNNQLEGSVITFNGNDWTITSYRAVPSPLGELDGEVFLILEAA